MIHSTRYQKCLFFLLLLFVSHTLVAQKLQPGPQVLTFFSDADDTEQPYGLYLPRNYDESKKYPVVIMLHGAGSNHRLALRRVFGRSNAPGETDVEATRYFPEWKHVEYIVAAPYARGTAGYQGIPEKDVYDVLADVKRRFSVDTNRIYLTGLSMGGGGTLWLGLSRPDVWAAIAPVCPAPPQAAERLAANALNYPVYFFQGADDPVVKADNTRKWVQQMKALGVAVRYDEYPGVQHDSWVQAYADGKIFNWFDTIRRNPYPQRVRFATDRYQYNKAYWLTLDALTPGVLASVDAAFTKGNAIEIDAKSINGFSLHLSGHPQYNERAPLTVKINGQVLNVGAGKALSFQYDGKQWQAGVWPPESSAKRNGVEGPISAAFSDRHIYVYGTRDNPSQAELQKRMQLAQQAANWSVYRGEFLGRMHFYPRVLSDKELRPSDFASSHLILFGTQHTNSVIHQYRNQLPLHLDTAAQNSHGLFYVYPVNGKYLAISSGLPWWSGSSQQGFSFAPAAQAGLHQFKDYILFQQTSAQKVAEGFFNTQWQLPDAEKSALMQSGVLQFQKQ